MIFGLSTLLLPTLALADAEAPTDLLTFAQGALPIAIASGPNDLRIGVDQAIGMVDGNPGKRVVVRKPATLEDVIEITISLPAPTQFTGFGVPNVLETPSPSQTFVGQVEVLGSSQSAEGPYVLLAHGTLGIHEAPGLISTLVPTGEQPEVSWVRLRLSGGTDIQVEKSFLEFSEIIGIGTQRDAQLAETFNGVFSGRGVKLELEQDGPVVSGCYDGETMLSGTVQGNVLRALGQSDEGIVSQFILIATADGFVGLRSTNGAPFSPYDGTPSTKSATCLAPEPPTLGCGSIIHGIGFDYDSDRIRPASQAVIEDLFAGLSATPDARVQIVGHSSSEGAEDYNRDLSQRRAASVVAALVGLGFDAGRISAAGRGEDVPIASNDDEAGRSLNRRVEVECAG